MPDNKQTWLGALGVTAFSSGGDGGDGSTTTAPPPPPVSGDGGDGGTSTAPPPSDDGGMSTTPPPSGDGSSAADPNATTASDPAAAQPAPAQTDNTSGQPADPAALVTWGQPAQPAAATNGQQDSNATSFSDDPLSSDGFDPNEPTIRLKPGPVRTTLIKPPRIKASDGTEFPQSTPNEDPRAWVQRFLSFFVFRRDLGQYSASSKPKYYFNNHGNMELDAVADIVVGQASIDNITVTRDTVELVALAMLADIVPPTSGGDDGSPLQITVVFSPTTLHTDAETGERSKDPMTVQVQGQYNFFVSRSGKSSLQASFQGQGQFTYDQKQKKFISQPAVGAQVAGVADFFTPIVQLEAFLNAVGGSTIAVGKDISSGNLVCKAVAMAQVAVEVQAVFTVEGVTGKHLQLVLQSQVSATGGSGITIDRQNAIGLQWTF